MREEDEARMGEGDLSGNVASEWCGCPRWPG